MKHAITYLQSHLYSDESTFTVRPPLQPHARAQQQRPDRSSSKDGLCTCYSYRMPHLRLAPHRAPLKLLHCACASAWGCAGGAPEVGFMSRADQLWQRPRNVTPLCSPTTLARA